MVRGVAYTRGEHVVWEVPASGAWVGEGWGVGGEDVSGGAEAC